MNPLIPWPLPAVGGDSWDGVVACLSNSDASTLIGAREMGGSSVMCLLGL